jgi:hypothetical protein
MDLVPIRGRVHAYCKDDRKYNPIWVNAQTLKWNGEVFSGADMTEYFVGSLTGDHVTRQSVFSNLTRSFAVVAADDSRGQDGRSSQIKKDS